MKVLLAISSFGDVDRKPLEMLEESRIEYASNSPDRDISGMGWSNHLADSDALIAGTIPVTANVMDCAPRLKIISRVGIGLDSVDLNAARERGIQVAYTPDAPSNSVAELTLVHIISLLRGVVRANRAVHDGRWSRVMGRSLTEVTVGLVGVNRIGKLVARNLKGLGARIIANDIAPDLDFASEVGLMWVDKEKLCREADVISLHIPLTRDTRNFIGREELSMMKPNAFLVNTARGGLIDEDALLDVLRAGGIAGAGLDVFSEEPYLGDLTSLENCLLTCHMGSMTQEARLRMEVEAVENVGCFLKGAPIPYPVPEFEYRIQSEATLGNRT